MMNDKIKILFGFLIICLVFVAPSQNAHSQFYIYKNYKSHSIYGNKLSIQTDGGFVEIEAWSDYVIRLSYDKDFKGNLPLSPSVIDMPSTISVQIIEDDSTLFYTTSKVKIVIHKFPLLMEYYSGNKLLTKDTLGGFYYYEGYDYHGIKLALKPDEQIYGFGSQAVNINRRNFLIQLYQVNRFGYEWPFKANLNFAVPFYMSSENYGIYFDDYSPSVVRIDTENKNVLNYNTVRAKLSFFLIAGDNYTEILNRYTELTGKQPLLPRWAMGYLQSRAYYNSEEEVQNIVEEMRKSDFPIDAIIFDATWYGGLDEMGNMFWSKKRFPNYEKMVSDFKESGIKTILVTQLYVSPQSEHYNFLNYSRMICHDKYRYPVYCRLQKRDGFLVYDMTNPDTWRWWWNLYKQQVDMGIAGWWLDGGEPDVYPNNILHSNGTTMSGYSNLINLFWLKMLYDGYKKDTHLRPFFMTRSGWAGAQRFGAFPLCGDEARSWKGLKAMVPVMLGASMSGISFLHSDVGGFAPKDALMHNELYIRWFQLGAFSPIMRAHRVLPVPAEPIFYDKYVQDIVRKYIRLRYTLLPYNYTLAYENSVSGVPLLKPVDFYDKKNKILHNINDEFLWGKDFLVAPVVDSVFRRDIIFPKGQWIDWFTGERFKGNRKYTINVPLDKLPLYVRSGSIIPAAQLFSNTKNYKADSLILHYFPDMEFPNSSFRMFNDDGKNPNSIDEQLYEFLNFSAICKDSEISFTLDQKSPEDKFKSVNQRDIKICIHDIPFVPGSLIINNKQIKVLNSFHSVVPGNEYAVFLKNKNELWVHLTWPNDSTNIRITNIVDSITQKFEDNLNFVYEFVPNPFFYNTKLEYVIDSPTRVECSIYELNGILVKSWSLTNSSAGKYYVSWDGKDKNKTDVESGVYLINVSFTSTGETFSRFVVKIK